MTCHVLYNNDEIMPFEKIGKIANENYIIRCIYMLPKLLYINCRYKKIDL